MPQRDNLIAKVWQRVRPTVSKGDQQFKGRTKVWQRVRPTVSKGEQKFVNKGLAKGETNSFKGRPIVSKGEHISKEWD